MINNFDFIQKTMSLDGEPWRFTNRPYIYPIVNEYPDRTLLMTGRQSEKSTTVSGKHIAGACQRPNKSSLYVSPTMIQTSVYSRKKLDEVFERSPLLKRNFWPGYRGFSVTEKRLKNGHTIYLRSAYHDADTIRGLSSDETFIDEIQDVLQDCIPVIEECSAHKPHATFMYTGTPKTFSNSIEYYWQRSAQHEWTIKCLHCGHWNMLGVKNVIPDKPGLWCERCQGDIFTQNGIWVSYGDGDIMAYRFPQIILPGEFINWNRLFWKIKNYSTAQLMNEVFGHSYDSGVKPITMAEVAVCCDTDREMEEVTDAQHRGLEVFAGIDWASGNGNAYTILTIGYFDPNRNKFICTYFKRYMGQEASPENLIAHMARVIQANNARIIGADYGFGFGLISQLQNALGPSFVIATMNHTGSKQYINYNKKSKFYGLGRTVVMSDVFDQIKKQVFSFPRWDQMKTFADDFLNIESEYSDRTGQMKYDHLPSNPDDSFHALLFMYVAFLIKTKRRKVEDPIKEEDALESRP